MTRPLSKLEQKFVEEGNAHFFIVGIGEDGAPYAMGANRTYNLFSMEVKETPEPNPGESMYTLPDDYYEYDFAVDGCEKP